MPHVLSPEGGNSAPADLSLPNIQIDDENGVRVPDVQSSPNQTGIVLDVGISPQEIPTSQDHPRDVPNNIGITPEIAPVHTVRGSNNVEWSIHDEEEPYENERAVDSDDDRSIPPLSAEDRELIRQVCPDIDPDVPEFSDV
ncbi:hypothetical protein PVAP13_6KG362106 [Panicum virgatum]|uniref:Uncharacterized protein n=1 Tax=Panicum virgatum TaxID=38727 RepID=A0A8T0RG14_PANVG|nr:hypothetical protein PVAP13_6KG362106 [Panicum virgatum]